FKIVRFPVAPERVELQFLRRNQEFEHEAAAAAGSEKIGKALQACRLPFIQCTIAAWVVTHQHFAEGRIERLNVTGEVRAIFTIELGLSAFLWWARSDDIPRLGIAQDRRTELFVDEDAGLLRRYAARERG